MTDIVPHELIRLASLLMRAYSTSARSKRGSSGTVTRASFMCKLAYIGLKDTEIILLSTTTNLQ
jgi:hypothetical protein